MSQEQANKALEDQSLRALSDRIDALRMTQEQSTQNILMALKETVKVAERQTHILEQLAQYGLQHATGQQMLMDAIMGVQHTTQMLMQQASIARPGIYNHPVHGMQYPGHPAQPGAGQWMPTHGYDINSGGGRSGFGRQHFTGQHSQASHDATSKDRNEIVIRLDQVRDTVIPSGEDIDPYTRAVIDLGAHLLRGTCVDSNNSAVNRGLRFYVYDNQNAGYLVFLVPDISWSNRVNTQQPQAMPVGIFTALIFTKMKQPTEKQINQVMEEVLHRFNSSNNPSYSAIASMSPFVGQADLKYPYQGLNFEQPIINLGNHPHHYLSFDMHALVAPTHRYGTL